jgi:hypothetical protein
VTCVHHRAALFVRSFECQRRRLNRGSSHFRVAVGLVSPGTRRCELKWDAVWSPDQFSDTAGVQLFMLLMGPCRACNTLALLGASRSKLNTVYFLF